MRISVADLRKRLESLPDDVLVAVYDDGRATIDGIEIAEYWAKDVFGEECGRLELDPHRTLLVIQ